MNLEELIVKAKAGDSSALQKIVDKFSPLVSKMANNTYVSGYDLEDLKQIGRLSIINAVNKVKLGDDKSYVGYISQAIKNNFYYLIRKRVSDQYVASLNISNEEGVELELLISSGYDLEEEYLKKELHEKLKEAIKKLSDLERELIEYIIYYHKGGLSRYSEIKGIPYTTCVKRKNKIFKKIKKEIS